MTYLLGDFNEPQKGKDSCDREFSYAKRRIRDEINSNPKAIINNAKKVVDVIMANGGPPNTRAIVLEIDKTKATLKNKLDIKNIRSYHSFQLEKDGIRMHEYWNIGSGNFVKYKGVQYTSGLIKKTEWIALERQGGDMIHRKSNTDYGCSVQLCKLSFKTESESLNHEKSGNHELVKLSKRDQILDLFISKKYAHRQTRNEAERTFQQQVLTGEQKKAMKDIFHMGLLG